MKTLITIATLVASMSTTAELHPVTYNWNNTVTSIAAKAIKPASVNAKTATKSITNSVVQAESTPKKTNFVHRRADNGMFGYNPYGYTDPRWVMAEMMSIIN